MCVTDTARDLATLHHICVTHLKELQVLSKSQVNEQVKLSLTVTNVIFLARTAIALLKLRF